MGALRNRRNFYRLLHVEADAPVEIIRASYRTIMTRLNVHPDRGGDTDKAALVNEAYETLSNPARRAAYDRTLADPPASRRRTKRSEPAEAPPSPRPKAAASGPTCAFCELPHSAEASRQPDARCTRCASPLFAAMHHHAHEASRRAADRVDRHMAAQLRVAGPNSSAMAGTIEDVSVGGVRVHVPHELRSHEIVRLDCEFCTAVGTVTRVEVDDSGWRRRWRAGIEFKTLFIKQLRGAFVHTRA